MVVTHLEHPGVRGLINTFFDGRVRPGCARGVLEAAAPDATGKALVNTFFDDGFTGSSGLLPSRQSMVTQIAPRTSSSRSSRAIPSQRRRQGRRHRVGPRRHRCRICGDRSATSSIRCIGGARAGQPGFRSVAASAEDRPRTCPEGELDARPGREQHPRSEGRRQGRGGGRARRRRDRSPPRSIPHRRRNRPGSCTRSCPGTVETPAG